jgi:hypothetical protein
MILASAALLIMREGMVLRLSAVAMFMRTSETKPGKPRPASGSGLRHCQARLLVSTCPTHL